METGRQVPEPAYLRAAPALFVAIHFCLVILTAVRTPTWTRRAWAVASRPFRNFLHLHDLLEPVNEKSRNTWHEQCLLSGIAGIEVLGWTGLAAFSLYLEDRFWTVIYTIYVFSWGYIGFTLLSKPIKTPPYLFLAFSAALSSFALSDLIYLLSPGQMIEASAVLGHLFFTALHILFIAVAGSLPLKPYLPGLNVAEPDAVPRPLPLAVPDRVKFARLDIGCGFGAVECCRFVPPYALQKILSVLRDDTVEARHAAYFWAFMTFLAHLSFAQVDLYQRWHTRRCYERTRGQLFCLIHYKSLRREEASGHVVKGEGEEARADLGKIVNLMQGDTYAVAQRFWEFSGIVATPVRIAIALVFLYRVLGWSAFMGVAVACVTYGLNFPLMRYTVKLSRAALKAKDKRNSIVDELLQNIRFLKFYGWEYTWSRKAEDARETELRWRVKTNIVSTFMFFIWMWLPSATTLVCFLCYTLIEGKPLTVAKAFTSIALFSALQGPLFSFPGQIMALLNAYISMQRIEGLLKEDEVPIWACSLGRDSSAELSRHTTEVGFRDATFQWQTTKDGVGVSSRFTLGPLSIVFPKDKLSIVSGATGSGKSALLQALLGEMKCISGEVLIDKSSHQVAYCAQTPWLEHATIRDNITFGSPVPFDAERYQDVVHACCLQQDLTILNAGDMTEIGEKGITLSGGQRARIALARALYSRAKVILLDDPLAAVDMHTAQHIVKNCFTGRLSEGRTIILVTHHISLCAPVAAYLLELKEGKVLYHGDTEELRAKGLLRAIIREAEEPYVVSETLDTASAAVDVSKPVTDPRPEGNGKLVEVEHRAEGRVSWRTYATYLKAAGVNVLLSLFVSTRLTPCSQVFLAKWGEAYEESEASHMLLTWMRTSLSIKYPWDELPPPSVDVTPWFKWYFYISAAGAFATFSLIALGYYSSLIASRTLFLALLRRLTRAPLRFFDTTPIGRILNRFTTDIGTIDGVLQNSARACLSGVLNFMASFFVMLAVVPAFAPWALLIAWLYIRLAPGYIRAARDLRRLESVALSPAFAGFDELLRGITHIRAFAMEDRYQDIFYRKVDKFQSFDHVYWLVQNWLSWRYDCLGSVVVFVATLFALHQGVSNGSAAIVIVQAGIFADASRGLVRVAAQLELDFNSVERVVEYLDVPQEAPAVNEDCRPPAYWPSNSGTLEVDRLVVKYAPHLPPVLKEISFQVKPGEKIGVVGRTGSGKSTLALSLLRMIEPSSGAIYIDGIDISKLGLEDLRTRVTIVSQDVSLFSGTIKSNIDPLEKHTQEEQMAVLERCHLTERIAFNPSEAEKTLLDMRVNQNSLSAGEKQLVALARAILRGTNIIIMDEATSQIDTELDDQIQKTIREETAGSIVITIAHRLKTVMDYDRILVLSDGEIAEFDTPAALLQKEGGAFQAICRQSTDWEVISRVSGHASESSK
ncbi:hypothetical protein NMY22_g6525 [Coprinellus aureogranulatus]|nr:hypothetical protein NMY22_g6525 [Coprinellus aureogranulatus]